MEGLAVHIQMLTEAAANLEETLQFVCSVFSAQKDDRIVGRTEEADHLQVIHGRSSGG
jgi:hypothetical protein